MPLVPLALRVLFASLGIAAVAISCRMNMTALAAIGGTNAEYLATVAVMTACVKAGVPVYADWFGRASAGARRGLYTVFWLAILFDVLCVLGFTALTRGAATDAAADKRGAIERIQADIGRAEAGAARAEQELQIELKEARDELARLNDASRALKFAGRTSDAVRPSIDAQRAKAGDCTQRGHVDHCQYLQRLLAEEKDALAREDAAERISTVAARLAAARAGAEGRLDPLRAALAAADRPASVTDPAARGMAELFAAIGMPLPEAVAGKVFSAVLVLFVELLAVYGLKAACSPYAAHTAAPAPGAPNTPARPAAPTSAPAGPVYVSVTPSSTPSAAIPAPLMQPPISLRSTARDDLVSWIAAEGGHAITSYRKVGAAIGVSAATAKSTAAQLAAEGAIEVRSSGQGTSLKILSAHATPQNSPIP